MKNWIKIGLPVLLIVVFALSRWPGLMPSNFSPVYALALCSGIFLPRKLACWLPLAVLLVTDLLLNLHYRSLYEADPEQYAAPMDFFNPYLIANYLGFGLLILLGTRIKPSASWLKMVGGGIVGALVFYIISNVASWLQLPAYPKTVEGLIQALTTGLPGFPPTWVFGLKTLLSGGLFTGLFAGAMKLAARQVESRESEVEEEAEDEEESDGEPVRA